MPTISAATSAFVSLPAGARMEGNGACVIAWGTPLRSESPGVAGTWSIGPFQAAQTLSVSALTEVTYTLRYDNDEIREPDGVLALSAAQVSALRDGNIADADGGIRALSEAVEVQTLTATGTAVTGACEFRGIVVRAISGTPQTVTVYDATSATGTPIATFTISALGAYYWDGDQVTVGNGNGGRRVCSTGCHVVISGGTSRTIDVMVE